MKHACLGWGSLVWDPKDLPIKGTWNNDGPLLPIEFARQSQDGRITLVLVPGKDSFASCWTLLDVNDSYEAKVALCYREGIPRKYMDKYIGIWREGLKAETDIEKSIAQWADSKSLTSVVWTALPSKFNGRSHVVPTKEEVIKYLENLEEGIKSKAREYVMKAPQHLTTEYRKYIENRFGWRAKNGSWISYT